MLMVNGLTPGDIASRGFPVLDLYLAQMAAQLKKKVGAHWLDRVIRVLLFGKLTFFKLFIFGNNIK